MHRSLWILLGFFALLCVVSTAEARTNSYWESVSAVLDGENLYQILDIPADAEPTQIKKGFRKVSLELYALVKHATLLLAKPGTDPICLF